MLSRLLLGCALTAPAVAQTAPSSIEVANLREDVRGLVQRVGDLTLRVEQLERDNTALRMKADAGGKAYATVAQLNEAVADLTRDLKTTIAGSRAETLQQVASQMEKLANQTNAALDSLAKMQTTRPAVAAPAAAFTENYAKEGVNYTVQKGDTLAVIAKKTGAKQSDIINANKLADPSRIVVGQTLFIPNPSGK
jgi:LysM repeat protein